MLTEGQQNHVLDEKRNKTLSNGAIQEYSNIKNNNTFKTRGKVCTWIDGGGGGGALIYIFYP